MTKPHGFGLAWWDLYSTKSISWCLSRIYLVAIHIGLALLLATLALIWLWLDPDMEFGASVRTISIWLLSTFFIGSAMLVVWAYKADHRRAAVQKKAEESYQRYRLLAENILDVIWTMDLDLKLTYVSPLIEKFWGYSSEESLTMTPDQYLTAESFQTVQHILQQQLEADLLDNQVQRKVTLEVELVRKDKTTFWSEVNVKLIRDESEKPDHLVGVSRDITDRKKAELHRQTLEAQLRHMQKMEAIGTLAGGIAHDFNNILAAMMGFAQVAKDGANEQAQVDLNEIIKAGHRAQKLVRQILTFSRRIDNQRQCIGLEPLVVETLAMMRSSMPPKIEVVLDRPSQEIFAEADPTQINQVLMNLCTNAMHAMERRGGKIRVSLQPVEDTEALWTRYARLRGRALCRLRVSDEGCGMDSTTLERIFDPFFTTKAVDKGTGLGLSVVHGIILEHGGEIEVESAPGQGTTFNLYLPLLEKVSSFTHSDSLEHALAGSENILLIDDDLAQVDVVRRQLEKFGFRVTAETDALEALRLVQEQGEFDLVITDQRMPNMIGTDLALQIRRLKPNLPVVLTTGGSYEMETRTQAHRVGVNQVVIKPFLGKELARTAREVLDRPRLSQPHARNSA